MSHPYFAFTSGGDLPPTIGFRGMFRRWMGGCAAATVVPPVPVDSSNTGGGRVLNLPNQTRGEDDDVKRLRRIREGTIPPDATPPQAPDPLAEYAKKSGKIAAALARLRAESEQLRADIARIEAAQLKRQTARAQRQLTLKRQAEQLALVQQAMLLEEMEAIDVAYCALAALSFTLQ